MLKKETRIIAFDDCAFTFKQKKVLVVGVVFRGSEFIDGLVSFSVRKDGNDATEKIVQALRASRHHDQLSYIMMKGISFGGLNIADIQKIFRAVGIPVIVIQRKKPEICEFKKALKKFNDKSRMRAVDAAGDFYSHKSIWFQCAGCDVEKARNVLDLACKRANVPEPLRVVHIIASGLSGDSRGRA